MHFRVEAPSLLTILRGFVIVEPFVYLAFTLQAFLWEMRESLIETDAKKFVVNYPTELFAHKPNEVTENKTAK